MTDPNSEPTPCVFCGRTDLKITREHVPAAWISKLLRDHFTNLHAPEADPDNWRFTAQRGDGPVRNVPELGGTVRDPCEDCNTGWMRDLQDAAAPKLTELILAENPNGVWLAPVQQLRLARWAYMTALFADQTTEPTDLAPEGHPGRGILPEDCFPRFYRRRNLPKQARIHLAAVQPFGKAWWIRSTAAGLPKRAAGFPAGTPFAVMITFAIYVAVFQVLVFNPGIYEAGAIPVRQDPLKRFSEFLFPVQDHPIHWPPNRHVLRGERELKRFASWDGWSPDFDPDAFD